MEAATNMVELGALVGDRARAAMLAALMGGQALTATELASIAGVSKSTASDHLGKLEGARLVRFDKLGRFSYYRIASPLVARMLESLMVVAAIELPPRFCPQSAHDRQLRFARTCYDHLAGRLGVAITQSMIERKLLALSDDGGELTERGEAFLQASGIALSLQTSGSRCFCRPCLDWSERQFHIAGRLGSGIWHHCLDNDWLARIKGTRAVDLTASGHREIPRLFEIDLSAIVNAA